jgi:hypothetical protein
MRLDASLTVDAYAFIIALFGRQRPAFKKARVP